MTSLDAMRAGWLGVKDLPALVQILWNGLQHLLAAYRAGPHPRRMKGWKILEGMFFEMENRVEVRDARWWSIRLGCWDREETGSRELRMALRGLWRGREYSDSMSCGEVRDQFRRGD